MRLGRDLKRDETASCRYPKPFVGRGQEGKAAEKSISIPSYCQIQMLTTIYLVRHALRCDFVVDSASGRYQNKFESPTGIDGDVPLAAKGLDQAVELAAGIQSLSPPVSAVYSSPFYR